MTDFAFCPCFKQKVQIAVAVEQLNTVFAFMLCAHLGMLLRLVIRQFFLYSQLCRGAALGLLCNQIYILICVHVMINAYDFEGISVSREASFQHPAKLCACFLCDLLQH